MAGGIHERYSRREEVEGSSDRTFGLVFAALFLILGLSPLRKGHPVRPAFLVASVVALLIALAVPALLTPLNRLWTKLALLLGKVTTPIVLTILFYGVFTPAGFILRLCGWDPLRLKVPGAVETFWITRETTEPVGESMRHMF